LYEPPYKPQPVAVSAGFRRLVLRTYPALAAAPDERTAAYWRILQYVLFSLFADEYTGDTILPYQTVAALVGVHPKSHGFNAGAWLAAFSRDVGLPLNPSDYCYLQGEARTVRPQVDAAVLAALGDECRQRRVQGGQERVWFASGERVSRRGERDVQRAYEEQLAALSRSSVGPNHPARRLVEYFLHAPPDCLERVLKRNLPGVREKVAALPVSTERERAKRHFCERLLVTLGSGSALGRMFYTGSERTPRVFAAGTSVHQLPRDLRQKAFAGCYECDLRAAQLAIVARLWDIAPLQEFLEGGGSIWEELAGVAGVPAAENKPILKRTVYSVVFGMGSKNVRAQLADGTIHGPGVGAVAAARVLKHPLMRALFGARRRVSRRVWGAGGARDTWGNWVPTAWGTTSDRNAERERPVRDVPSVLAAVVQSYEMRLLLPVLGVIAAEPQVYLLSWLHDGVTLHLGNKEKANRHLRKLAAAVQKEADAQAMTTRLEVTGL